MDPVSVTQALKEACSIVDDVLPLEEFGRGKSVADRTELRSVSLPLVFTALLGGPAPVPGVPEDEDDDEVLTSGQAARILRVDPNVVISYAVRGFLDGFRTPGGRWRFRRSDVHRFRLPADANLGLVQVSGDDIVRMRDDEKMSIGVIAGKTGLSSGTIRNMYRKAQAAQALQRLAEFKAANAGVPDPEPGSVVIPAGGRLPKGAAERVRRLTAARLPRRVLQITRRGEFRAAVPQLERRLQQPPAQEP